MLWTSGSLNCCQLPQSSSGNILDNEELISTLETSKAAAEAVKQRLAAAQATRADIRTTRAAYAAVPRRGVLLFFATQAMTAVDVTYQHSLRYFLDLYLRSLDAAAPAEELEVRLAADALCLTFGRPHVCRGLRTLLLVSPRCCGSLLSPGVRALGLGKCHMSHLVWMTWGHTAHRDVATWPRCLFGKPSGWVVYLFLHLRRAVCRSRTGSSTTLPCCRWTQCRLRLGCASPMHQLHLSCAGGVPFALSSVT